MGYEAWRTPIRISANVNDPEPRRPTGYKVAKPTEECSLNFDTISETMRAIGPQHNDIDEVEQIAPDAWTIAYAGGSVVGVEWLASPSRLVLTALVGVAAESRRLAVYETLLIFNSLWRDHDGVRLALTGPDGQVQLIFESQAPDMTSNQLHSMLGVFIELAALWSTYVTTDSAMPPDPTFPEMLLSRFA